MGDKYNLFLVKKSSAIVRIITALILLLLPVAFAAFIKRKQTDKMFQMTKSGLYRLLHYILTGFKPF